MKQASWSIICALSWLALPAVAAPDPAQELLENVRAAIGVTPGVAVGGSRSEQAVTWELHKGISVTYAAVSFQEEMTFMLDNLRTFDEVMNRQPHDGAWRKEAQRRWGHVVFRYRHGIASHRLTEPQLTRFERITGFRVDLAEIRRAYLKAGLGESLLQTTLNKRFEGILSQVASAQRKARSAAAIRRE